MSFSINFEEAFDYYMYVVDRSIEGQCLHSPPNPAIICRSRNWIVLRFMNYLIRYLFIYANSLASSSFLVIQQPLIEKRKGVDDTPKFAAHPKNIVEFLLVILFCASSRQTLLISQMAYYTFSVRCE